MIAAGNQNGELVIGCYDINGRPRDLRLLVDEGRVVLVVPPGETAVLFPGQMEQLQDALRETLANAIEHDK